MIKAPTKIQNIADAKPSDCTAVLDEFGELDRRVQAFKPAASRHKLLRETILAWYPDLPGDQAASLSGQLYDVRITECDNETHVLSMPKLFKAMGRVDFLAACKVTIKAMQARLGEAATALHLEKRRTGPRHVVAVPKASPVAMAKAA